jgi:hypothetical protein
VICSMVAAELSRCRDTPAAGVRRSNFNKFAIDNELRRSSLLERAQVPRPAPSTAKVGNSMRKLRRAALAAALAVLVCFGIAAAHVWQAHASGIARARHLASSVMAD